MAANKTIEDPDVSLNGNEGGGFAAFQGGVVNVGKSAFAVGMLWETADDITKAEKAAKESAKSHNADLYVVRAGGIQNGIGSKATGHKAGMPSLGALFADTIEGSFIGAFQVAGGYYVIAIRDEKVLAISDRIISSQDEAIDFFSDTFHQSDWTTSIAPKEWGIDTTGSYGIDVAVEQAGKPSSRLKPISGLGMLLKAAGILVVFMLAGGGYTYYQQMLDDEAEQQRLIEASRNAEAAKKRPAPIAIPPLPFEGKPNAVATIDGCVNAILRANISVAGWKATAIACDGNLIKVSYKRDGGTVNWIGESLNKKDFRPTVILTGNGADVAWPIQKIGPSYSKDSPTTTVAEARKYLFSQFEELFDTIELKDKTGQGIQIPGPRGQKQEVLTHKILEFSFKTRDDPREFVKILSPIPAAVTTSVRLDLATWTWLIEGAIYEKLPLPASVTSQVAGG